MQSGRGWGCRAPRFEHSRNFELQKDIIKNYVLLNSNQNSNYVNRDTKDANLARSSPLTLCIKVKKSENLISSLQPDNFSGHGE